MLVAAAVCPHPPLLIPELAAGAAPELDPLRRSCDEAVRRLLASRPDIVVCVGESPTARRWGSAAWGSFASYGVDVRVGGAETATEPPLPLSLAVAAWLLDRAGYSGERCYEGVCQSWDPARCLSHGAGIARAADRVGILAMGDGSARRTTTSPGTYDPRAEEWDAQVAAFLATGDLAGLGALRAADAEALLVAGRPAWQVLAGAADGRDLEPTLLAHTAPYGVGYFVASWVGRDTRQAGVVDEEPERSRVPASQ
jgi:hypothetical protein